MTIEEAKDSVAISHNYASWHAFRTAGEPSDYYHAKYEYLEEAFELYAEQLQGKLKIKSIEISKLNLSEMAFKLTMKNMGNQYRLLISEHIARLRATIILNKMMATERTHRQKEHFMDVSRELLEKEIKTLIDEYKTSVWKFGEDFTGDDLPF